MQPEVWAAFIGNDNHTAPSAHAIARERKDGMGAELTLGKTSAWMVTKSSRRRTWAEERQISLDLQGQELLKLKTCSREAAPETEEITEEGTEVQLKHTHCSQAIAGILPTPGLCQSGTGPHVRVCSALTFHRKGSRPATNTNDAQWKSSWQVPHRSITQQHSLIMSTTDHSPIPNKQVTLARPECSGYSPAPQVGSTSSHHGSTNLNKSTDPGRESLQNTAAKIEGQQGRHGSILRTARAESQDD